MSNEQSKQQIKNVFNCTAEDALKSFEDFMTRQEYTETTRSLKRAAVIKWINEMFGKTKQRASKEKPSKKTTKISEKQGVKDSKAK